MKRIVLVSIAAALVVIAAATVYANLSAGAKAPDFTLPTLDGKSFTLSDCFKGKPSVVLLDIWAIGCPPCRAEIPYLVELSRKYDGKGAMVVGVSLDLDRTRVRSFAREMKINYTVPLDPRAQSLGRSYKITSIPATYILDRKGIIRFAHTGFPPKDAEAQKAAAAEMDKEIAGLLAEK